MNMILRLQEAGAIPTLAEEVEAQDLGPESQFTVSGQAAMDWLRSPISSSPYGKLPERIAALRLCQFQEP